MLALFGVPVAQEEHAWRAVQAALELQQRLRSASARHERYLHGEALTARVGVHTGWVVAGSHRDEVPQFVVVGGDTTQGAMRLQALADPGTLLVSDTTLRLLHSTVCSTAYGLVHVPGHAEPPHDLYRAEPGGPDCHPAVESLCGPAAGAGGLR